MLAPLDNGTIFKKAFTDKIVFEQFIEDIFGVKISVSKIETEKSFYPKKGNIDFRLDVYAETIDNRFIIEIQRIDYDYNFDRFLHYFLNVITEQQRNSQEYEMQQDVLAIVVLTQPYIISKKTGQPMKDNVMKLDFDLENLRGEKIKLWGHNIVFLNPHPKYEDKTTPVKYQDWLDLFQSSIEEKVEFSLNLKNLGIQQAINLIDYENLTPRELAEAKITSSKKAMRKLLEEIQRREMEAELKRGREEGMKEGREEGREEGHEEGHEEGIKEGREEGHEEGIKEGREEVESKLKPIIEQKNQALISSVKMMKGLGATTEQIQESTGMSKQEIEKL